MSLGHDVYDLREFCILKYSFLMLSQLFIYVESYYKWLRDRDLKKREGKGIPNKINLAINEIKLVSLL